MTQIQTEPTKTIGKRRSFSAWLRRKVTPKGTVRKISPRSETTFTEPRGKRKKNIQTFFKFVPFHHHIYISYAQRKEERIN